MLNTIYSGQFKKDYKKCMRRGWDMDLLKAVVAVLSIPDALPKKKLNIILKNILTIHSNDVLLFTCFIPFLFFSLDLKPTLRCMIKNRLIYRQLSNEKGEMNHGL